MQIYAIKEKSLLILPLCFLFDGKFQYMLGE